MEAPNRSNPKVQDRDFLQIVLAESNSTISEPIVAELGKDQHRIVRCANLQETNRAMDSHVPDLLIIGNLEDSSCLEVFRECAQKFQNLPIILLCHTLEVNQFFKDWVVAKGGCDVMSGSPTKLHLLRQGLQNLMGRDQSVEPAQAAPAPAKIQEPAPPPAPASKPASNLPSPPPPLPKPPQAIAQNAKPAPKEPVKAAPIPTSSPGKSSRFQQTLTYQQTLAALNEISEISLKYFGGLVIGNYWKKAHKSLTAEHLWLECWSVDHTGVISFVSQDIPQENLTERQFESLLLWVKGFLKECDRIIADYIELLRQSNPSEQVKQIITNL
ncbi:response regulator transcription factor [Pseudanabaena sp. PCC 6802]|uniref:response regulator transcription factor n=1 Tax=Pseudanabaena sp. PCC 6802 TaxID=118173 RepID=UPI00034A93FE|nr:response regulator transcription factor [Pseudanabaena sp. PCC 6802]